MNTLILIFYRIAALFTRVTRKTRDDHALISEKKISENDILSNGYIEDQSDFCDIPFGNMPLSINGCGPIALFNTVYALKNKESGFDANKTFLSILKYCEHFCMAMKGRFGSSPGAIRKYLNINNFKTGTIKSTNADKINGFSENYKIFVSIFYNDSKSIKNGLHYVCIIKNPDGSYTSHNPNRFGKTLYETISKCSDKDIRHVYTIGIK